jgi:hypothetical protein
MKFAEILCDSASVRGAFSMSMIVNPGVLSLRLRRAITALGVTFVLAWYFIPVRDTQSQATVPDYKNAHLPVEQRVADLLSRMTLEEETALIDGQVAFRQHSGGHTPSPNWRTFLTVASRYLKGPTILATERARVK